MAAHLRSVWWMHGGVWEVRNSTWAAAPVSTPTRADANRNLVASRSAAARRLMTLTPVGLVIFSQQCRERRYPSDGEHDRKVRRPGRLTHRPGLSLWGNHAPCGQANDAA